MTNLNIGDLVVRSYCWHSIVPGIIVDVERETIILPADTSEHLDEYEYNSEDYVIKWSDGMLTTEIWEEIEPLEHAFGIFEGKE